MLSICVTIKNRSRVWVQGLELQLFPNFVRSLAQAAKDIPCELVVADWHSDDWPLGDWLTRAAAPVPARLVSLEGHFSRGAGLNQAAAAAEGTGLFFADADALLGRRVLQRAQDCLRAGEAFFPVLYSYSDSTQQAGWWRHSGFGHCCLSRDLFTQVGGWPVYQKWGREDVDFFQRVSRVCPVVREEVPEFFHQWHPDDLLWKDHYSQNYPALKEEHERVSQVWHDFHQCVPPGASIITADECRFGIDPFQQRIVYPFPEKNGEYWGPPENDAHAIAELERLSSQGGQYLAFGWMTFWWLDYYQAFAGYLAKHFSLILENERVKLFDLQRRR